MTRQARLLVMITKLANLMITARPCLLSYRHDPACRTKPACSGTVTRLRKGRGCACYHIGAEIPTIKLKIKRVIVAYTTIAYT